MRPTRITVLAGLVACLVVGAVACGIDAVGKKDVFEATPSPGPSSTGPGATQELDASTGTIEEDATIGVVEDAAVDAFFDDDGGDAAPDAPPVTTLLQVTSANAPATVDLPTQGTIDWAYWGANGVTSPVRKTPPNVISSLGIYYNDYGATANGFGTTFSWANAGGSGASDGYLYVKSTVTMSESFKVPSGPTTRTAVVWVGGNDVHGKLSVRLVDGGNVLTKDDASYGNGGAFGVQYTIDFRSIVPSSLEVKWEIDQTYGVNSLRFAAVALR
jgi:hypothetical protein